MKYRILVLTAILFTACNLLHAQVQTGKLSGVIIDANNEETLVGANIYVESLKKGTSTDKNGQNLRIENQEVSDSSRTGNSVVG